MKLGAVFFDLDGTLIDSRRDITAALNHSLARFGRSRISLESACTFIGDGAMELVRRAFELSHADPLLAEAHAAFIQYYTSHAALETTIYPGAIDALDELTREGVPLALCTNKPRQATEQVLATLDLSRWFRSIACGDDATKRKPDPAPLTRLAEKLGVHPHGSVMVGDGPQDIRSGQAAGCITVGVSYGIHPDAMRACGPNHEIRKLGDLVPLLRRLATFPDPA